MRAYREEAGAGASLPFRTAPCCGPEPLSLLLASGAEKRQSRPKRGRASVRSPHRPGSAAGKPCPPAPLRRKGASGFTLLEVLIALGLLAILSAALYGTFFTVMRGRDAATAAMAERRELRNTLDMLRRELSASIYKSTVSDPKKRYHFVVEDRDFFGKPASTLNFTTIAPPRSGNQALSDQMEVRYQPVDKDGKMVLARQVKDVYMEGDSLPYPQMEQIEGFLVECTADGTKWVRTWDTALNPRLPKAVKVTISVREGNATVPFTTIATPWIQQ